MSHLTDDDLVLHYYGEDGSRLVAAERHLRTCAQCASAYAALSRTLSAVTPPTFVDVPDELPALRQVIRDRVRERSTHRRGSESAHRGEVGALAAVWLAALVYPFSFDALFNSARLAQEHAAAMLLVVPSLLWACGGPLLAVLVLNRVAVERRDRHRARAGRWLPPEPARPYPRARRRSRGGDAPLGSAPRARSSDGDRRHAKGDDERG